VEMGGSTGTVTTFASLANRAMSSVVPVSADPPGTLRGCERSPATALAAGRHFEPINLAQHLLPLRHHDRNLTGLDANIAAPIRNVHYQPSPSGEDNDYYRRRHH
jgi:hypothetical protein